MQDLGNSIDSSKWPAEIPQPKGKQRASDDEYELDGSETALMHEAIEDLELDDRHAEFLTQVNLQEEDEVDRLLGKIAEQCEEFSVDLTGTEDMAILFR